MACGRGVDLLTADKRQGSGSEIGRWNAYVLIVGIWSGGMCLCSGRRWDIPGTNSVLVEVTQYGQGLRRPRSSPAVAMTKAGWIDRYCLVRLSVTLKCSILPMLPEIQR
jgi:hypothetical protein